LLTVSSALLTLSIRERKISPKNTPMNSILSSAPLTQVKRTSHLMTIFRMVSVDRV
jgi:hypothetical protein